MGEALLRLEVDGFVLFRKNKVTWLKGAGRIAVTVVRVSRRGRDFIELTVADNGPGIPPELRDRVFEKAERESNAYFATSRLWDDGLLAPTDTRNALGMALSAASHAPIGEPHYGIFRL